MKEQEHYLVVGAGIGGLSIAYHLFKINKRVTLIDRGKNQSSIVAAGLINPLVFRRMTKSWRVDELIPYATSFYRDIENETQSQFFHPITIRRFFSSIQERGYWETKQSTCEFEAYMEKLESSDYEFSFPGIKNEFGSGRIKNASWINTNVFLTAFRNLMSTKIQIHTEEFDYSLLDPVITNYKGIEYDGVVFCNGYENYKNPYFAKLPVQTTKGEVLTVSSKDLPKKESINRKCFVLPIGEDKYRVGATYVWETPDDIPTEEGRSEILNNFKSLTELPIDVVEHLAGIRPTSPDRRPIIGVHTEFEKLYLFNGLGTKGYMIAPLLAKEFVDFMMGKRELEYEVDLCRFLK